MTPKQLPLFIAMAALAGCGGGDATTSEDQTAPEASVAEAPGAQVEADRSPATAAPTSTAKPIDPADLWDTDLAYGYAVATPSTDVMERGREVYIQWCEICHGTGVGMAGTSSLARKYKDFEDVSALLTERNDLYPEVTKLFVRQGVKSMPYFRKTEISDEDLDALATYLAPKEE